MPRWLSYICPPAHKDGLAQFALIDSDGYVLRPRVASKFTLPVITGIREAEPIETRRARVRRVLACCRIGPLAGQVSEVDASDPNDLLSPSTCDGVVN